jgi:hypothetical protein
MKRIFLLSLIALSQQVFADDVCGPLQIFSDSNGKNAVAVLSKDRGQKVFAGTYEQFMNRAGTESVTYDLKDANGGDVTISIKYSSTFTNSCTRASCEPQPVHVKKATITIDGVNTYYTCSK